MKKIPVILVLLLIPSVSADLSVNSSIMISESTPNFGFMSIQNPYSEASLTLVSIDLSFNVDYFRLCLTKEEYRYYCLRENQVEGYTDNWNLVEGDYEFEYEVSDVLRVGQQLTISLVYRLEPVSAGPAIAVFFIPPFVLIILFLSAKYRK
ncbi:MAG: hypothetical protein INQ03_16995 [Candidatus Heimdallarchaeota archaeon]|nr:hypothetical protein [Candidatus Heimdallarchaeota archaeon]